MDKRVLALILVAAVAAAAAASAFVPVPMPDEKQYYTWRPLIYYLRAVNGTVSDSYPHPTPVVVFDEANYTETAKIKFVLKYYSPPGAISLAGTGSKLLYGRDNVVSVGVEIREHYYDYRLRNGTIVFLLDVSLVDTEHPTPGYYEYLAIIYFKPPPTGDTPADLILPYPYVIPLAVYVYPWADREFHAEYSEALATACFGLPLTALGGVDVDWDSELLYFDKSLIEVVNRKTMSTYPFYTICYTFRLREDGVPDGNYTRVTPVGFVTNVTWRIKYYDFNGNEYEFNQTRELVFNRTALLNETYFSTSYSRTIIAPGYGFFIYRSVVYKPKSLDPIMVPFLTPASKHEFEYENAYFGVLVYKASTPVLHSTDTYIGAYVDGEEYKYRARVEPYNGKNIGGASAITWYIGKGSLVIWWARINATGLDEEAARYARQINASRYTCSDKEFKYELLGAEDVVEAVVSNYKEQVYYAYGIVRVTDMKPSLTAHVEKTCTFIIEKRVNNTTIDVRMIKKTFTTKPPLKISLLPGLKVDISVTPAYTAFLGGDLPCNAEIIDANFNTRGGEITRVTVTGDGYRGVSTHITRLTGFDQPAAGFFVCIKMYDIKNSHVAKLKYIASTDLGVKATTTYTHVTAKKTRLIIRPVFAEKQYMKKTDNPLLDPEAAGFQPWDPAILYVVYLGLYIKEDGGDEYIYPLYPIMFDQHYKIGGDAWYTTLPPQQWGSTSSWVIRPPENETKHYTRFNGRDYNLPKPVILLHSGVVAYPYRLTENVTDYFYNYGSTWISTKVYWTAGHIAAGSAKFLNKTLVRYQPPYVFSFLFVGFPVNTTLNITFDTDWWGDWDWSSPETIFDYGLGLYSGVDIIWFGNVTSVPANNTFNMPDYFMFYAGAVFYHRVGEIFAYTPPYPYDRHIVLKTVEADRSIFCVPLYYVFDGVVPEDIEWRCGFASLRIYVPRLTRGLTVRVYAEMGREGADTVRRLESYYMGRVGPVTWDPANNIAVAFGSGSFTPRWPSNQWVRVADMVFSLPTMQRRCVFCGHVDVEVPPPDQLRFNETGGIIPPGARLTDAANVSINVYGPIAVHAKIAADKYIYAQALRDASVASHLPLDLPGFRRALSEYVQSRYRDVYGDYGVPLYFYAWADKQEAEMIMRACEYQLIWASLDRASVIDRPLRSPDGQIIYDFIYVNSTNVYVYPELRCSEPPTPFYLFVSRGHLYVHTLYGDHYIGQVNVTGYPGLSAGAGNYTYTPPPRGAGGGYDPVILGLIILGVSVLAVSALYLVLDRVGKWAEKRRGRGSQR